MFAPIVFLVNFVCQFVEIGGLKINWKTKNYFNSFWINIPYYGYWIYSLGRVWNYFL